MATTVRDFMCSQLVYLRQGVRPHIALRPILDFGITAVPVLDDDDRPVGIISLRDLVDQEKQEPKVSARVISIGVEEPVAVAARTLAESGVHHLVVLDARGRAVGMLSALDVIRALMDMPPKHPEAINSFGRHVTPWRGRLGD